MCSQIISDAYLCHSQSKVDPIHPRLEQKPNKHTQIRPQSGILRTHPQWNVLSSTALYDDTFFFLLSIRVRLGVHNPTCHLIHTTTRNAPASHPSPSLAALPDSTEPPPFTFAPAEFQRTCAPPEEELLVDSGFDRGDGEAECRRACAAGRGRCWETMMARREAILIPFQVWLASSGFCAHAHVP